MCLFFTFTGRFSLIKGIREKVDSKVVNSLPTAPAGLQVRAVKEEQGRGKQPRGKSEWGAQFLPWLLQAGLPWRVTIKPTFLLKTSLLVPMSAPLQCI